MALQASNPVAGQGAPLSAASEPLYEVVNASIGGGATVTLTPINGGTQANVERRTAYDLVLEFETGGSPTTPLALVQMVWSDTTGVFAVAEEDWVVPMGPTAGGLLVRGTGPMRGALLEVNVTNLDNETDMLASFHLNASSRPQTGSDWRHNPQNMCPGFLVPTGGLGFDNCLGALQGVDLPAGTSQVYLLGLFAGNAYLRIIEQNASSVTCLIQAILTTGTSTILNADLSTGAGSQQQQEISAILPRAVCQLVLINNDDVNDAEMNAIFTAQPIS